MQSVLPAELQTFEYYRSKLPTYLQESYGFIEHFKLWYDLMMGVNVDENLSGIVPCGEAILYLLNIFDSDDNISSSKYLSFIKSINGSDFDNDNVYGTKNDMLDKLAALFGVKREFSVSYNGVSKQLKLNNYELLLLIKTQIINNYCEGSYEQIQDYYSSIGLNILQITSSTPASCDLYCQIARGSDFIFTDNIEDMFLAGLLTIKSMGISYKHYILNISDLLVWYLDESIFDKQLNPNNPTWNDSAALWDSEEWGA